MTKMTTDNVLIDSSFLFAMTDPKDKEHHRATAYMEVNWRNQLIPDVVLTEVTYLIRVSIGQRGVLQFLDAIIAPEIIFQSLTPADLARAREIMEMYLDARFDFVDYCIMALSERLEVTRVCTFDRRDFAIFRPKHCDYLELLP